VSNGITRNSVLLSWTATGDDGAIGRAMQYDLRYSELEIVENGTLTDPSRQVEFQNATPVAGLPAPQPAGNREFFTVPGLNSNTVYTFAIKAIDKGSNASPISSSCAVCANPLTVAHTALHAGYNLVSIPYRFNSSLDPATVFGNDLSKPVTLYQWVSGNYEAPSLITEATGYFLFAAANNSVLRASDSGGNPLGVPETAADFAMPLSSGWNIIGNPYLHPVYLKDTCIRPGFGASVPFATAVANGWVGSAVYSFDGTQYLAERYQDILPPTDPNYQPPALLGPWNGYWLQLLTGSGAYYILYPDSPGICP